MQILSSVGPRVVGAYVAFGSEADLALVIGSSHSFTIALPAMVDPTTMVFRAHEPGGPLLPDAFAIPAPPPGASTVSPDFLLVPVTAFDRLGSRLGKGRGIYDRAVLALRTQGHDPMLVGIAFSVQEVPSIPVEAHDVRLDRVVTEIETRIFPSGR
jgi:5-formyltetrahydrofolate cyclo-ligase